MAEDSLFLIDIDRILREKAPKQSKYVPRFVVSYLKHIVHQDELKLSGGLPGVSGCQD